MKKSIFIENVGNTTITDKNYIGAGGEASVYKHGKLAIKLYHDNQKIMELKKLEELNKLTASNILKPLHIVYDIKKNKHIGYAMQFIKNTESLCKLFTKGFKNNNNISHKMIIELIKKIQSTIATIHADNCIIVDLNEMNIIVSSDFKTPYFIDTDSWQTPSFKPTAIMESIRDRTVQIGTFNELTDWYAFAIIAFQLYIGIHPYKGKHPKYKMSAWPQRMEDGISVFDSNVSLPSICNDFNVIPPRHRMWMEDIFLHNKRSIPPQIDTSMPIIIVPKVIVIKSTQSFEVELVVKLNSKYFDIRNVYDFIGTKYFATKNDIYKGKNIIKSKLQSFDKVLLCETDSMAPITCKLQHNMVTFEDSTEHEIGKLQTSDILYKTGKIYTMNNGGLYRNSFLTIGNKILHKIETVSNVSDNSKMFEGVVYQDLLGKSYLTIPLNDRCFNFYIKELDGFRILDMKVERQVGVVMAEKKGKYHRFVIIFNYDKNSYNIRIVNDVQYDDVNFTVMLNGICVLSIENNQVEVFMDNSKMKLISNSPFDSSMKLISFGNDVFFVDGDELYKVRIR